ncbi:MAG: redox-regulated ATPase YchF [Deltaproteobacteria bacterium CG_4_8_14_3_um_filter_51_11]|nr:redox-regulated ATPase YchF [bacterium]OIP42469.1 MAG: GTP-binding protein [Desulfobacteraceae bacterium CG2_30_51_40]PIP46086.1 MAG: redox-regulated ATPase YchF [Deltaproteobacteria bacterium CG23_combo_of_CG06-09_8_20_14_all_51_20]PIX19932.1 MAG: redox-regulated ATPase YchF [Deltaproteobacteria bacterium CG_4_8_14_3_um_filter_51_11]PIY21939.1 MAG: redox-regulated ATPase YchF [Deltaproteobacteria bacterium CG_4_10_14_3_um_filter_51_14]PJB37196.1 MAG: redox-regulated ATPase YchF [Deltaprote
MYLGIIGLPGSGRSTVFAALSGARGEKVQNVSSRTEPLRTSLTVFDERIPILTERYKPKKTTYARIDYLLPFAAHSQQESKAESAIWNQLRTCDALLHVVRNFGMDGLAEPDPESAFWSLEEEMVLSDLLVAEKRIERIELDRKRGKKPEGEEFDLIMKAHERLEKGEPLRSVPELALHQALRGFTFLSAKPMLVVVNNDDETTGFKAWNRIPDMVDILAVRGRLEMEIAAMTPEESAEFRTAYGIEKSAVDRIIAGSYRLLDRISFFTVGPDEVRAWPIAAGTPAVDAAGAVHTDMKKGFIRAEVLAYDDFMILGGFQEAKKAGKVRLEGKDYIVKDGDIITFRFNI